MLHWVRGRNVTKVKKISKKILTEWKFLIKFDFNLIFIFLIRNFFYLKIKEISINDTYTIDKGT